MQRLLLRANFAQLPTLHIFRKKNHSPELYFKLFVYVPKSKQFW